MKDPESCSDLSCISEQAQHGVAKWEPFAHFKRIVGGMSTLVLPCSLKLEPKSLHVTGSEHTCQAQISEFNRESTAAVSQHPSRYLSTDNFQHIANF